MDNQKRYNTCKHSSNWDCEVEECGKCGWYEPVVMPSRATCNIAVKGRCEKQDCSNCFSFQSDDKYTASETTRKERNQVEKDIEKYVNEREWQEVEKAARRLERLDKILAGTQFDY